MTITAAGTYVLSGTSTNGQIVVDWRRTDWSGWSSTGSISPAPTSAPIYVKNAEKVILILADGTENARHRRRLLHA